MGGTAGVHCDRVGVVDLRSAEVSAVDEAASRPPSVVRPAGNVLALHVLYYPAQVRPAAPWEAELRAGPVVVAPPSAARLRPAPPVPESISGPASDDALPADVGGPRLQEGLGT